MRDVLGVFNRMKEMYQRYMDSPFALGHEKLSLERRSLLEEEGVIYQFPYIEAMPAFKSSGQTFSQVCEALGLSPDVASFSAHGLFPETHLLHKHQYDALEKSLVQKRNVVVTSGTGSGKTESFLLPLISSIVTESSKWQEPKNREMPWWESGNTWYPNRRRENRPSAIRGLILYPLNALVEDQLVRLRRALDSDSARLWLDKNRNGNRIYFGRYTGKTPVAGPIDNNRTIRLKKSMSSMASKTRQQRLRFKKLIGELNSANPGFETRQQIQLELQNELDMDILTSDLNGNSLALIKRRLHERLHEKLAFLSQPDEAEMVSRWDMQFAPPDIFITNFSMLNILLTRQIEQGLLEKTREWLRADKDNTFFLVVDELHTYRGTAGTEVSYILRCLLERLGLTPDSPQLRIIATSASLDENGMSFLQDFFGVSEGRFDIVSGERESANKYPQSDKYKLLAPVLSAFFNAVSNGKSGDRPDLIEKLVRDSHNELNEQGPYDSLFNLLVQSGAMHEIIQSCERPRSIKQLSLELFEQDNDLSAIGGFIHALIVARDRGAVPLPLRAHLFFRNFPGLWACSNPDCSALDDEYSYEGRTIGKLYTQPQLQCTCGSRILDLYYCQNCGDVFLGGYKATDHFDDGTVYLSADFPELESLPDKLPSTKKYGTYALFWPAMNIDPDIKPWNRSIERGQGSVKAKRMISFAWNKAHYDHHLGKISVDNYEDPNGYWFRISGDKEEADKMPAFPIICPHCADDWESKSPTNPEPLHSTRRSRSPIRGQRTGFDMIAQVMLDALLRELAEEEKPKAVLFSDSRQDAAKLSAKIELNHYYHLLRSVVVKVIRNQHRGARAFIHRLEGKVSSEENALADEYWNQHWEQASLIESYIRGISLPPGKKSEAETLIKEIARPAKLGQLWDEFELILIKHGINPGGPLNSVQYRGEIPWTQLYNWTDVQNPVPKMDLSIEESEFRRHIRHELRDNVLSNVLFSQRKRDLESLSLGWITTDFGVSVEEGLGKDFSFWRELIDSSLRILGGLRRYDDNKISVDAAPSKVREYWTSVAKHHGLSETQCIACAEEIFSKLKGVKGYLIQTNECYIVEPDKECFKCIKCHRIHLHGSCGICTDCNSHLEICSSTSGNVEDYYRYLAQDQVSVRRLHSEELTGQTDDAHGLKRQQVFQGIFDETDIPLVDEIDLLSVTTTMEAGVDIGSLRVVAMSNMPPQRFNYQQRVGRTGRRGSALSMSLTLCRGRSHDDWYFDNLDKMTGDPPPQPYIDLASDKIFKRVLNKEMLFYAFTETGLSQEGVGGESVHGEFGLRNDWLGHKMLIESYLSSEKGIRQAKAVIRALAVKCKLSPDKLNQLLNYVTQGGLVADVTRVSSDPAYSQNSLSENLASAGLLPMFGFPTRVRLFHHANKSRRSGAFALQRNVVDRDLELAINEYAPGSEIIKDKVKHKAVGLVHYWLKGNQIVPEPNPFGDIKTVGLCTNCQILYTGNVIPDTCSSCKSSVEDEGSGYKRIRLSEPQGFRSDWKKRDFREEFEWASRSSIPRLAHDGQDVSNAISNSLPDKNLSYIVRDGNVYSINDNYGRMFTYRKAIDDFEGWIEADRIGVDGFNPAVTNLIEEVALASIKNTDVLLIEPNRVGSGLTFDTRQLGVRAALISFGFLFRRVATNILDVDADELQVGLRPLLTDPVTETLVGQIFFADRLINGAGYARHLADSKILNEILADILSNYHYLPKLRNHQCDSSCYECLRTYENMNYHGILDWRLAVDVARVFWDASYVPEIDEKWLGLIDRTLANIEQAYEEATLKRYLGVPAVCFPEHQIIALFGHPLWDRNQSSQNRRFVGASAEALKVYPSANILRYDIFDLIRRPTWVLRDIWQSTNPWI